MTTPALAALAVGTFVIAQAASPTSSPIPLVTATATPAFNFVYKNKPSVETTPFPGPNPPQIDEIDLSDATLVTPGTIRVRVFTSDPVVTVVAETFGNTFAIPKNRTGVFTFEGYVGEVPPFVKNRTYDVTFTASTSDGRNAAVTLPLTLR